MKVRVLIQRAILRAIQDSASAPKRVRLGYARSPVMERLLRGSLYRARSGIHAAALAIVAWYLMIPPVNADNRVDARAALSKWRQGVSFASKNECEASLKDAMENPMTLSEYQAAAKATLKAKMHPLSQSEMTRRMQESVCVSSDDPRLKAK